jgi:cytochrome c-type biogenesis protein
VILAAISLSPVGLATAFAAGFASFLSPCVLPLVPAYLSFVSGVGYGDLQQNTRRVTMATAVFVLGFTIVFSAYGAGVGWAGSLLNDYRRSLELIGGFLMILMGLALIGFASQVFGREYGLHWKPGRASFTGALLTGAAFAIGWTPCIGPVLSAILTFAAQSGPAEGAALLIAYSLGLGVPFLICGLATSSTLSVLGVFKRHGALVNRIGGVILVGAGILLATGEMTRITAELGADWNF